MHEDTTYLDSHEELRLSVRSFRVLGEFITERLGIKMPESKLPMLRSRLQRRLRALNLDSIEAYKDYLLKSPHAQQELADFFNAVTTNKTDFFRESKHFDFLQQQALPSLDPSQGYPWKAKVWCAGCSSGEEAYTLAMVLSEFGHQRGRFDFGILATDICTTVLDHARAAIYEQSRIEPIPEPLRKKYLLRSRDPSKNTVRITPELRSRVHFHRLNFMDEHYPVADTFDAIFFRNVEIYFDRPTQQAVVEKLCRNLRPGGYLFIGHSESLLGLDLPLRMVTSAAYRKTR